MVNVIKSGLYYGSAGTGKTTLLVESALQLLKTGDSSSTMLLAPNRILLQNLKINFQKVLTEHNLQQDIYAETKIVSSLQEFYLYLIRLVAKRNSLKSPIFINKDTQQKILKEIIFTERKQNKFPTQLKQVTNDFFLVKEVIKLLDYLENFNLDDAELKKICSQYNNEVWEFFAGICQKYQQILNLRFGNFVTTNSIFPSYINSENLSATINKIIPAFASDIFDSTVKNLFIDDFQNLKKTDIDNFNLLNNNNFRLMVTGNPEANYNLGIPDELRVKLTDFSTSEWEKHELIEKYRFSPVLQIVNSTLSGNSHKIKKENLEDGFFKLKKFSNVDKQAENILNELKVLHSKGVKWNDIAIVTKDINSIKTILKQLLATNSIPFSIPDEIYPLAENFLVRDLLNWLKYISQPSYENFLAIVDSKLLNLDHWFFHKFKLALRKIKNNFTVSEEKLFKLIYSYVSNSDISFEQVFSISTSDVISYKTVLEQLKLFSLEAIDLWEQQCSISDLLSFLWNKSDLEVVLAAESAKDILIKNHYAQTAVYINNLFNFANNFETENKGTNVSLFIEDIKKSKFGNSADFIESTVEDKIQILTASSAIGREWDYVFIYQVEEDNWPKTSYAENVFAIDDLCQLLLGYSLAEVKSFDYNKNYINKDKKLFFDICARAKIGLYISTVETNTLVDQFVPSRFVVELNNILEKLTLADKFNLILFSSPNLSGDKEDLVEVNSISELILELRNQLLMDYSDGYFNELAKIISIFALAGVNSANPLNWYGNDLNNKSNDSNSLNLKTLTPSLVKNMFECILGSLIRKYVPSKQNLLSLKLGTLVHELIIDDSKSDTQKRQEITEYIESFFNSDNWLTQQQTNKYVSMLDNYLSWKLVNQNNLHPTEVVTEQDFIINLTEACVLKGRIDRIDYEKMERGVVITDFKTSNLVASKSSVQDDIQLMCYQLGIAKKDLDIKGARLVYLDKPAVKTGVVERWQFAKDPVQLEDFSQEVLNLGDKIKNNNVTASFNEHCTSCPLKRVCPVYTKEK